MVADDGFASFDLGPLRVLLLATSAGISERTSARIATDPTDSLGVMLATGGRARGEAIGASVVIEPGSILILDYGQPFRILNEGMRNVVTVIVPRALFPTQDGDPGKLHMTMLPGGDGSGGAGGDLLSAHMRALPSLLPGIPEAAGPRLARIFLDLLAVARGCFGHDAAPGTAKRDDQTFTRARRLVDMRLGSADLSPAWLADRLSISRSELYRLMERHGGVSRFILSRRLAAAHAALCDRGETRRIGELAYAFGFASDAHFARSFRLAYGRTATAVRQDGGLPDLDAGWRRTADQEIRTLS